eukprot:2149480-Pleurochrysis_carterae.AAC.5
MKFIVRGYGIWEIGACEFGKQARSLAGMIKPTSTAGGKRDPPLGPKHKIAPATCDCGAIFKQYVLLDVPQPLIFTVRHLGCLNDANKASGEVMLDVVY